MIHYQVEPEMICYMEEMVMTQSKVMKEMIVFMEEMEMIT